MPPLYDLITNNLPTVMPDGQYWKLRHRGKIDGGEQKRIEIRADVCSASVRGVWE